MKKDQLVDLKANMISKRTSFRAGNGAKRLTAPNIDFVWASDLIGKYGKEVKLTSSLSHVRTQNLVLLLT